MLEHGARHDQIERPMPIDLVETLNVHELDVGKLAPRDVEKMPLPFEADNASRNLGEHRQHASVAAAQLARAADAADVGADDLSNIPVLEVVAKISFRRERIADRTNIPHVPAVR